MVTESDDYILVSFLWSVRELYQKLLFNSDVLYRLNKANWYIVNSVISTCFNDMLMEQFSVHEILRHCIILLTYKIGRIVMWHNVQSNITEKVYYFTGITKISSLSVAQKEEFITKMEYLRRRLMESNDYGFSFRYSISL